MQKSVLTEIIRSLHKKEIRELNKWLQSPAHNQRQDVVRLFEYLVKNVPNGDESLQKERAWKAVAPGEPFDDAFMRQVMYFLLKAIEEYIVFSDVMDDKVRTQLALARSYRKRKLDKAYRQAHRLGHEHLESQPLRNTYYLLHRFFWEQEEYEYKLGITQNDSVNLQEMAEALEKWFVVEKLMATNAMIAHRKVYQKANYEFGLLPQVLAYTEDRGWIEQDGVALNYYAYKVITEPEKEEYFEQMDALLSEKSVFFQPSEVRNHYITAVNYCVSKVNTGRSEFVKKLFALYREGIESGYLFENNMLTQYTFGNAIGAALRNREYQWAENFIEKNRVFLEEKYRDSIVNFNQARLFFEKRDYTKAQKLLAHFDYHDMLFNIIAKTMLLKIYYEQDEYDTFESLLDSLRIYLQRQEALDPGRKTAYKNMISLMKKLLSLKMNAREEREKFRLLVQNTTPLMERDWLMEQVKD